MERETAPENAATLERLLLRPEDRVLEVGFGPGRAIERVAAVVIAGSVTGVDISEDMLGTATRRCERFIRQGRVDLRLGDVARLPFESASFDKACSVHTLYFWPHAAQVVGEIRRVLKPGGVLALCFRPSGDASTADFPPGIYRFDSDEEVVRLLREGGFRAVSVSETGTARGVVIATGQAA